MKSRRHPLAPVAWPRSGVVRRLYLNYAGANGAGVHLEQSAWPRQKQNPRWTIIVTRIDGRYAEETRQRIRKGCEDAARLGLSRWLADTAPALRVETATWQELVSFATAPQSFHTSDQRAKRRALKLRMPKRIYAKGLSASVESVSSDGSLSSTRSLDVS